MGKILLPISMLGQNTNDVLRREVTGLSVEKQINGDEVWTALTKATDIPAINEVLKTYFGNELKVV